MTRYRATQHAVQRFISRVAPDLTAEQARIALLCMAEDARRQDDHYATKTGARVLRVRRWWHVKAYLVVEYKHEDDHRKVTVVTVLASLEDGH